MSPLCKDHNHTYTEYLLELLRSEERMPPAMRIRINERSKAFLEAVTPDAERFLRDELDFNKHTNEEVRTLIQSIPNALLVKNYDGMYPIQSITWDYSEDGFNAKAIPFLPLLAEEGAKLNVGGDGMRGGILIKYFNDSECDCILEELFSVHQCEDNYSDENKRKHIETICLNAITSLQNKGLFQKEDIKRYNLVSKSCHPSSIDRFKYAVELNPEALTLRRTDGDWTFLLLHDVIQEENDIEVFQLALKAGLEHFPHQLGFLFQKGDNGIGTTLFQEACKLYGKLETWRLVEKCFDEMGDKEAVFERNPCMAISKATDTLELDLLYYLLVHHPVILERTTTWVSSE